MGEGLGGEDRGRGWDVVLVAFVLALCSLGQQWPPHRPPWTTDS